MVPVLFFSTLFSFIGTFLSSKIPQKILNIIGSGRTVQPGLKLSDIKNLEIPIPPFEEQHQIVSILSNINEQITQQQSHLNNLKVLRKSILNSKLTKEKYN